jgi:hypothetical protein
LTERAAALEVHVRGYALSLRGETGAPLLGTVFPSTTVLDPTSIGELAEFLDRAKEGTRVEKARSVLADDLGRGVSASWSVGDTYDVSGGRLPVTLTLQALTVHAPLVVSNLTVGSDGGAALTGAVPTALELAPGGTRSFDLVLLWEPKPGLIPLREEVQLKTVLAVTGTVASPWSAPLQPDITLDIPTEIAEGTRAVSATAVVGTWRTQLVLGGVLIILVLAALTVVYLRRRARLSGALVATTGDNEHLGRFRLRGRRTRVRGQALPGRARVIAHRVPRTYQNPNGIEYEIHYRRTDEWISSRFPTGGSALVGGVNFAHEETSRGRRAQLRSATHAGAS